MMASLASPTSSEAGGVCFGPFCVHVPTPFAPRSAPAARTQRQQQSSGSSSSAPAPSSGPASASDNQVLAALQPPSAQQTAVLKGIYPSKTLGAVGVMDDLADITRARNAEQDRDYARVIADIVSQISDHEATGRVSIEEDISEHSVSQALATQLIGADLPRFETFRGENWSAERLRKMVLDFALNEVQARSEGAKAEKIKLSDLDGILKTSSQEVYYRVFETSEMLASASGQNWFLQRLYKLQGAQVKSDLRENIEHWLEDAANLGAGKVDGLALGESSRAIGAYRFRAERIVFDCLTDNVADIAKSQNGKIASPEEIHQRIEAIAADKCVSWVMTEFADHDGKLKIKQDAPKPYPLRVIWTANGPKNDGDLYVPAADKV